MTLLTRRPEHDERRRVVRLGAKLGRAAPVIAPDRRDDDPLGGQRPLADERVGRGLREDEDTVEIVTATVPARRLALPLRDRGHPQGPARGGRTRLDDVVEKVAPAGPAVDREPDARRRSEEQPARESPSDARGGRRQTQRLLRHHGRRAPELEQPQRRRIGAGHDGADQLACIASRPRRVARGREIVDSDNIADHVRLPRAPIITRTHPRTPRIPAIMTDARSARHARPTLVLPLAVFGAAMMMHQLSWTTLAAELLGGTGRAQALVLAVFMGGMAFGAQRHGRAVDAHDDAPRRLVRLQLFIAAMTAVLPLLVGWAAEAFGHVPALRWLAAVAIFTPATIWMGGTFPVIVRAASLVGARGMQQRVGALAAAQSCGAIVGVLVGGLVVTPAGGVRALHLAALALSLVAAALFARQRSTDTTPAPPDTNAAPTEHGNDVPAPPFSVLLLALALVGASLLGIEIVVTRLAAIAFGSTSAAFAMMLAGVLIGLALGAAWTARSHPRRPVRTLAVCQLAAPVALVFTLPLIERLGYFSGAVRVAFVHETWGPAVQQLAHVGLVAAVLVIPMAAIGAALPLAAPIALRAAGGRVGTAIGAAAAASALGNVGGALGTALWLIPAWGPSTALLALMAVHAAAATLFLVRAPLQAAAWGLGAAALVTLAVSFGLRLDAAATLEHLSGHLRWRSIADLELGEGEEASFEAWTDRYVLDPTRYDAFLLAHDDHVTASALQLDALTVLSVNGKPDSSIALVGSDMVPMLVLGHLPLFFAPEARRALVIGWGGGTTAAAMLHHPLEHLDAVEISPAVLEVAQIFEAGNGHPRADERLTLRVADGRLALRASDETWDVIVSQPSNPWVAGMGALFTREAFAEARARLNKGGVYAMWIPEYEQDDGSALLILRTLRDVFAHVEIFRAASASGEAFLLASDAPLVADFAAMETRFDIPDVADDLARAGRHSVASLLAAHALTTPDIDVLLATRPGPVNTDAHERLQHIAPAAFFAARSSTVFAEAAERVEHALLDDYEHWRAANGAPITREEWSDMLTELGRDETALAPARRAGWEARRDAALARTSPQARLARAGDVSPAEMSFHRAIRSGLVAAGATRLDEARARLGRAHALRPTNSFLAQRLAQLLVTLDNPVAARAVLERALAAGADDPVALHLRLAPLLLELGDEAAAAAVDEAVLAYGEVPEALLRLGERSIAEADWDAAIGYLERSLAARRSNPRAAVALARILWQVRTDAPAALAVLAQAEAGTDAGRAALAATRREIQAASAARR